MAETISASQIPQHVSARLSYLTSRPGVQSTLILSRKDGSIIQVAGELAPRPTPNGPNLAIPASDTEAISSVGLEPPQAPPQLGGEAATSKNVPYKPSQAETLAAHIFAFVSSGSALSRVLSNPSARDINKAPEYPKQTIPDNGQKGDSTEESQDSASNKDCDEDDEVKLLRLRTKSHEIIIYPDRSFLLCVVHDVSAGGGPGTTHR
ncbi:hypothetical protein LOZ65_005052 [Ophidiomyces ophidiicola]|nr:hypothetical protein LOZ65_005052 [Ophidiomyces ophidiicola]